MQIKIVEKPPGDEEVIAPVEVHGPDGFIAGWSKDCLFTLNLDNEKPEEFVSLGVVERMLDAAFEAGEQAKATEIKKALNIGKYT